MSAASADTGDAIPEPPRPQAANGNGNGQGASERHAAPTARPAAGRNQLAAEREGTSKRLRRIALPSDPAMPIRLDRHSWRTPYPGATDPTDALPALPQDGYHDDPGQPVDEPASLVATRESRSPWHLDGVPGPLTGEMLGEFELGAVLGTGGLGMLYRARERSFGSRVALRTLPFDLARDQTLRALFASEVRLAADMLTQHLVRIVGAGGHTGCVYLANEFIEATDLGLLLVGARAQGGTIGPERGLDIAIQSCRALAEAADHGLAHLDLRPANLLVNSQGLLRLAGFGLSSLFIARDAALEGSPTQRGEPDITRDLYALGALLFEMVAGEPPFTGRLYPAPEERRARAATPLRVPAALPAPLRALLARLLAPELRLGYQDPHELLADLEHCRADLLEPQPIVLAEPTAAPAAAEAEIGAEAKASEDWPVAEAEVPEPGPPGQEAGKVLPSVLTPLPADAFTTVGDPAPARQRHSPRTIAVAAIVLLAATGCWLLAVKTADERDRQSELAGLRQRLAPLAQAQPLPASAADEVERMAQLEGADDPEVQRYRAKISRCQALHSALEQLVQSREPGERALAQGDDDLHAYAELVGGRGSDFTRWSLWIESARSGIEHQRRHLAALDQPDLSLAAISGFDPELRRLEAVAEAGDPAVKRWRARIDTARQRMLDLHRALAAMDGIAGDLGQQRLTAFAPQLHDYLVLVGQGDADGARWQRRLEGESEEILALRQALARLDQGDHAALPVVSALTATLEHYRALVGAADADGRHWAARIQDATDYCLALERGLAPLQDAEHQSEDELTACAARLVALRLQFGGDDVRLHPYDQALGAARARLERARSALAMLDRSKDPGQADLEAAAAALAVLDAAAAGPADQRARARLAINAGRGRIQDLRRHLAARMEGGAVTDEVLALLDQLAASVGEDDAQVRGGRDRASRYRALATALGALDHAAAVPADAEARLADYQALVGPGDPALQRWHAKLQGIAALRLQLQPLARCAPVPAGAEQAVSALTGLVGADDLQLAAARTKLMEVSALKQQLLAGLRDCYVLPAAAPVQLAMLKSLVGDSEDEVRAWSARVSQLSGPPVPSWAFRSGRDGAGLWADLVISGVSQRFRFVPSGTFIMGSPPQEAGRRADEDPFPVTITRSFWLADSPCTQAFLAAAGGTDHCSFHGPERPVEDCSFNDVQEFLQRLNRLVPALGARLPSEAEWEYACRAGSAGARASDRGEVGESQLNEIAWFAGDAGGATHEVRQLRPNRLGLFDMLGDVGQWCQDGYAPYPRAAATDPLHVGQALHVVRGGSWSDPAEAVRAAARLAVSPETRLATVGMRLAADVAWSMPQTSDGQVLIPGTPSADR